MAAANLLVIKLSLFAVDVDQLLSSCLVGMNVGTSSVGYKAFVDTQCTITVLAHRRSVWRCVCLRISMMKARGNFTAGYAFSSEQPLLDGAIQVLRDSVKTI
jgi:hypothetical protein